MTRALDHIVWPARNLNALADAFRRLGFTVGRRNRHPWGTENHIVQFDGAFLELLGFAPDYVPAADDAPSAPFAGFCARFVAEADTGAAMLVLRSDDAAADAVRLRQAGLGQGRLLPFARAAQGPDGADRTVAFTIAFADLPGLPEIGAFLCQHHRPENFWNEASQWHGNGSVGIAGTTILGPEPETNARVLRSFADASAAVSGRVVDLGRGSQLSIEPRIDGGVASISAVEIRVSDLAPIRSLIQGQGMDVTETASALTVRAPALGHTALVFRR